MGPFLFPRIAAEKKKPQHILKYIVVNVSNKGAPLQPDVAYGRLYNRNIDLSQCLEATVARRAKNGKREHGK